MKTVFFLCGLIGSGKTTFARSNFDYFTDLDFMPSCSRKSDQIEQTKRLLKSHDEVCHITCYPTAEEVESFRSYDQRFLLITTGVEQARTNILIRQRPRDLMNLNKVLAANNEYLRKYKKNEYAWEMIKVFNND